MRNHIFMTITIDLCIERNLIMNIFTQKAKRLIEEKSYAEAKDILLLTDSLVVVLKYDYEDKKILIR